ncbi:hypothetical protein [Streptomyces kaniharaensis]|uniref:hypothetical protein n=1 Tax=Streptomyces kaniharaensis TaxID=212423 RepID=UPI001E49A5EA|nr:hypothetical protein [Streptomyces kaniharaensis]
MARAMTSWKPRRDVDAPWGAEELTRERREDVQPRHRLGGTVGQVRHEQFVNAGGQ